MTCEDSCLLSTGEFTMKSIWDKKKVKAAGWFLKLYIISQLVKVSKKVLKNQLNKTSVSSVPL